MKALQFLVAFTIFFLAKLAVFQRFFWKRASAFSAWSTRALLAIEPTSIGNWAKCERVGRKKYSCTVAHEFGWFPEEKKIFVRLSGLRRLCSSISGFDRLSLWNKAPAHWHALETLEDCFSNWLVLARAMDGFSSENRLKLRAIVHQKAFLHGVGEWGISS